MDITKRELKLFPMIVLTSLFAWYLAEPLKDYLNNTFQINPFLIGLIGLISVSYFYNLNGGK